MKWTIGTPDMGWKSAKEKVIFVFGKASVALSLISTQKLKDQVKVDWGKELNLNPPNIIGILDVKVLVMGIMRSGVNIEQLSGRDIKGKQVMPLLSMEPGYHHSIGLGMMTDSR